MPEEIDDSTRKLRKNAKVNTAFDSYTLIKQIGNGGNGSVFSASNSDDESVAIKFVKKDIGRDKLKRFKNEIYFCETHRHKNIVEILDRGYALFDGDDYAFYVMPLYSKTLKDKIAEGISPNDAIFVFASLLDGLKYAHSCGTIHRDIKPENILFKDGSIEPIICDFGIAHFSNLDLLTEIETRKGDRLCNYQYCAPEQKTKGGKILPQTDIYAAALILNEMFTGEIPLAPGFKTISSVDSDYGYLDEVISEILIQDPEKRLYPEDKILSEMKILAKKHKREEYIRILQEIQLEHANSLTFDAKIISQEYDNGKIIFAFNRSLPDEWYQIIAFTPFSNTAVAGYEKERLILYGTNKLALPIRGNEKDNTLKDLITYMNSWVSNANGLYVNELKRSAEIRHEEQENKRRLEIKRLENENRLNSIISSL